jgi:hypothetical protein
VAQWVVFLADVFSRFHHEHLAMMGGRALPRLILQLQLQLFSPSNPTNCTCMGLETAD